MALYQYFSKDCAPGNVTRTAGAVAHAGTLNVARALAGDTGRPLQPTKSSMQRFLKSSFAASPPVKRAMEGSQGDTILLTPSHAGAGSRWARPEITPHARLFIDPDRRIYCQGSQKDGRPPPVVMRVPAGSPVVSAQNDAAQHLLPLGAQGTCAWPDKDDFFPDIEMPKMPRRKKRARPAEGEEKLDDDEAMQDDGGCSEEDAESLGEYDTDEGESSAGEEEDPLRAKNPVPEFDGKVELYETGTATLRDGTTIDCDHTYLVDGEIGYTSTTTLIEQWLSPFDAPVVAERMVSSGKWPGNLEYRVPAEEHATKRVREEMGEGGPLKGLGHTWPKEDALVCEAFAAGEFSLEPFYEHFSRPGASAEQQKTVASLRDRWLQLCREHIQSVWKRNAELGTAMHERIEFFYKGAVAKGYLQELGETGGEPELLQFLRWHDEWLVPRGYEPFRMELRLYHERAKICGSVDALFRHKETGQIIMVDWKRAKKISFDSYQGRCGTGPLDEELDTNFTKYTMQQNVYKLMLEMKTNIRLGAMYLLICHPNQGTQYNLIEVPAKEAAAKAIMQRQIEKIK